jgi:hypothetical protein
MVYPAPEPKSVLSQSLKNVVNANAGAAAKIAEPAKPAAIKRLIFVVFDIARAPITISIIG